MIDVEKSIWVQNRIIACVDKCVDTGHQLNFRCPICGDSKRNTSKRRGFFYKNTCSYYCFNCDATLIGLNIVAEFERRSITQVKQEFFRLKYGKKFKIKGRNGIKKKKTTNINTSMFLKELPEHALQYLQDRKILDAPFLPSDYKFMYDTKTNRLVIPWVFDDEINYYQSRLIGDAVGPKYLFPTCPKGVFNIDRVDPTFMYIFVLEGALDAIYVKNGVAIGGKHLTNHQRQMLSDRWPNHKIVYFLDNHYIEDEMAGHLLDLAEKHPQDMFLLWPAPMKSIKDVNDWIVRGGKNIFMYRSWLEKNILSSLKVKFLLSTNK